MSLWNFFCGPNLTEEYVRESMEFILSPPKKDGLQFKLIKIEKRADCFSIDHSILLYGQKLTLSTFILESKSISSVLWADGILIKTLICNCYLRKSDLVMLQTFTRLQMKKLTKGLVLEILKEAQEAREEEDFFEVA